MSAIIRRQTIVVPTHRYCISQCVQGPCVIGAAGKAFFKSKILPCNCIRPCAADDGIARDLGEPSELYCAVRDIASTRPEETGDTGSYGEKGPHAELNSIERGLPKPHS